jgi:hypothetical protein
MDTKQLGEQLAFDIVEIATRHHIISEILAERLYEDFEPSQILALDKEQIIEGALAEFRETFIKELDEVLENAKEQVEDEE